MKFTKWTEKAGKSTGITKASVLTCIEAARAGGRAIADLNLDASVINTKDDEFVGKVAIQTGLDFRSQAAILQAVKKCGFNCRFITEEHVADKHFAHLIIRSNDLANGLKGANVLVIDELDGTPDRNLLLPEWSVSVGFVKDLIHLGGAIYVPWYFEWLSRGGLLFCASSKQGAFAVDKKGQACRLAVATNDDPRVCGIRFGIDCGFAKRYPIHHKLMGIVGSNLPQTILSTALGLCLVAFGKADALVEPLNGPWDYAAGKVIVEEAGGVVHFYEMAASSEQGRYDRILPIQEFEPSHFNSDKRNLGFVAGNSNIASNLMSELLALSE